MPTENSNHANVPPKLPPELWEHIFAMSQNPAMRLANRQFHQISKSPANRATFLARLPSLTPGQSPLLDRLQSRLLTPQVLQVWIRRGLAEVHADNDFLLRWVAANNRLDLLQSFLEQVHPLAEHLHADNDYALRVAAQNGHLDVVKLLVKHGANLHVHDDHPLRTATQFQHTAVVEYLLQMGANVHADGDFAVRTAAADGNFALLRVLLKHGADPQAHQDEALILAVVGGHLAVVQTLIQDGDCDGNARNGMPLQAALQHRRWDVVRYLMEQPAVEPTSPLLPALESAQQWSLLESIVERRADPRIDAQVQNGTLLEGASDAGQLKLVQLLLSRGARIPSGLITKLTSSKSLLPMAQLLLEHGALLDRQELRRISNTNRPFGLWIQRMFPNSIVRISPEMSRRTSFSSRSSSNLSLVQLEFR